MRALRVPLTSLSKVKLECDQFSSVALVPAASCDTTVQLINRRVLGITSTSTATTVTITTTTTYNQTIKDEEDRLARLASTASGGSGVFPWHASLVGAVAAAACAAALF